MNSFLTPLLRCGLMGRDGKGILGAAYLSFEREGDRGARSSTSTLYMFALQAIRRLNERAGETAKEGVQ